MSIKKGSTFFLGYFFCILVMVFIQDKGDTFKFSSMKQVEKSFLAIENLPMTQSYTIDDIDKKWTMEIPTDWKDKIMSEDTISSESDVYVRIGAIQNSIKNIDKRLKKI